MIEEVLQNQKASKRTKLTHKTDCPHKKSDSIGSCPYPGEDIIRQGSQKITELDDFGSILFSMDRLTENPTEEPTTFESFEMNQSEDDPHIFTYSSQNDNLKSQRFQELYQREICSSEKSTDRKLFTTEEKLFTIEMRGQPLICLEIDGQRRLCLAQISSTLLHQFSYNEIHNRRVALGITCVQCTPSQLELLREAGAMPTSSRRCGTITHREAERLVKSFLDEPEHPKLPENFAFIVLHHCGWGCRGTFMPSRYSSSRAKCIRCDQCQNYFSPNKFIFHCHSPNMPDSTANQVYRHPDAANFNAWRRHLYLADPKPSIELLYAWEDVKAMFNGGNRKRQIMSNSSDQSMEFQMDDSVRFADDNDDNDDEEGDDVEGDARHKRSKLSARRKNRRSNYFDCPLTMGKEVTSYDLLEFDQVNQDPDQSISAIKSSRGREFLIENVIRDRDIVESPNQCKFILPDQTKLDSNQGQIDPLNLSSHPQTTKSAFQKRCGNENMQLQYATPRAYGSMDFNNLKDALIRFYNFKHHLPDEAIKLPHSNIASQKINPYDSPISAFPNLFTYPSIMNMATNRNEALNSTCSALNNSWPLIFLNHIFHLMGTTDSNQLFGSTVKQSIINMDMINFCHSGQVRHEPLAALPAKSNLWLSHLQNTNPFENNVPNFNNKN